MSITVNSILTHVADLSATEVDGRVVVLSLKAGSYFDFNNAATEIWTMLSGPRSVAQIIHQLSQHHDVDAEILARDVMKFLQALVEQRLVRIVAPEEVR